MLRRLIDIDLIGMTMNPPPDCEIETKAIWVNAEWSGMEPGTGLKTWRRLVGLVTLHRTAPMHKGKKNQPGERL